MLVEGQLTIGSPWLYRWLVNHCAFVQQQEFRSRHSRNIVDFTYQTPGKLYILIFLPRIEDLSRAARCHEIEGSIPSRIP